MLTKGLVKRPFNSDLVTCMSEALFCLWNKYEGIIDNENSFITCNISAMDWSVGAFE